MKVSVVIPSHNRSDALRLTLERLALQKFDGAWETIVVNNNSIDDTDEVVRAWQPKFPVSLGLEYEKFPGASSTRNAGAKAASGEYLIFIDNDILTEPDFLELHVRALEQYPNSWVNGQVMNLPEQENTVFGQFRKLFYPTFAPTEDAREVLGITGQNLSLPRRQFLELDGFNRDFYSSEDNELAMRGRKQFGIKTMLVPRIVVVHNDWAGWTFEEFCLRQRIYARSEFLFWERYGDEHPRLQLVKENLPSDWEKDSVGQLFRKQVKHLLGKDFSQKTLLHFCALLERSHAPRPLLWRFYKLALAGAINRGFREGRQEFLAEKTTRTEELLEQK